MPITKVNIGQKANDGTGDPLRTAFGKVNDSLDALVAEKADIDHTHDTRYYTEDEVDALIAGILDEQVIEAFIVAASDETSDLTTGTGKVTFRMPYDFVVTEVRASVNTAPTGAAIEVDVNEDGNSILSTVVSIDANETTSTTAATAAVISDALIAEDAEVTIDIDQVGSVIAGTGLKVTFLGYRA